MAARSARPCPGRNWHAFIPDAHPGYIITEPIRKQAQHALRRPRHACVNNSVADGECGGGLGSHHPFDDQSGLRMDYIGFMPWAIERPGMRMSGSRKLRRAVLDGGEIRADLAAQTREPVALGADALEHLASARRVTGLD